MQVYEPKPDQSPVPPDDDDDNEVEDLPLEPGRVKYVVSNVPVYVVAERVQHYGTDGKLITESLKDYTRKTVRQGFTSLDAFLSRWSEAEQKQAIIQELQEQGIFY